jgi:hypothetical protein
MFIFQRPLFTASEFGPIHRRTLPSPRQRPDVRSFAFVRCSPSPPWPPARADDPGSKFFPQARAFGSKYVTMTRHFLGFHAGRVTRRPKRDVKGECDVNVKRARGSADDWPELWTSKKKYKFAVVVLDMQAYKSELPWTHTAALFRTSPRHHHFSIMSSVSFDWGRGDLSSWSRKSSAPTPSLVVGS